MNETKKEKEKLAKIQLEMERHDDCDIYISKRDGTLTL